MSSHSFNRRWAALTAAVALITQIGLVYVLGEPESILGFEGGGALGLPEGVVALGADGPSRAIVYGGGGGSASSAQDVAPPSKPRIALAEVTTVLNATTPGNASAVAIGGRGGYLSAVAPVSISGTAIPRGRVYAEADVVDSMGNRVMSVWAGYMVASSGTKMVPAGQTSVPGIWIDPSWSLVVVATQTGRGAGMRVGFQCVVTDDSPAGSFIFSEPPISGAGERVNVTLPAPGAGAEYASLTVPACVAWMPISFGGTLNTSVAVANRLPTVILRVAGTMDAAGASAPAFVTASLTSRQRWAKGNSLASPAGADTRPTTSLPDVVLPAAGSVIFFTTALDAADTWSAGIFSLQEWAVPA